MTRNINWAGMVDDRAEKSTNMIISALESDINDLTSRAQAAQRDVDYKQNQLKELLEGC